MYLVAEQVLGFEVTVDNVLLVHVPQPHGHLLDNCCCLLLRHFSFLFYLLQTAVGEQFHHEVEVLLIVEVAVEGGQVRVVEVALQFDLAGYVLYYVGLFYAFFGHFLQHAQQT